MQNPELRAAAIAVAASRGDAAQQADIGSTHESQNANYFDLADLQRQLAAMGMAQERTTAVTPPSTRRSVPVMNAASGLSRNAAAAAMSSGVPIRPLGDESIMARIASPSSEASSVWLIGVEMMPGLIALIRAPRLPHVALAARTRMWFACLEMP